MFSDAIMEHFVRPPQINKRRALPTSDKVNIITSLEKGLSNFEASEKYKLPVSTISTIWKNREKIMKDFRERNSNFKRRRRCKLEHVDEALYQWYKVQVDQNLMVTRAELTAQARKLAKDEDGGAAMISHSWIERFKVRHNIELKKAPKFGRDPAEQTLHWINEVRGEGRKHYNDDEIFIICEAGLFYDLRPDTMSKFGNATCGRGELSQERVSVLMATNFSGTEKRKLLVVGECRKVAHVKTLKNLPVKYEANENSWITSKIFEKELQSWDAELRKKSKKILVLALKAQAPGKMENLTNIDLIIFPDQVTFLLKPIITEIVKNFKYHYRRNLILELLNKSKNKLSDRVISLLKAMRLMAESWSLVCEEEIRCCFMKSEIFQDEDILYEDNDNNEVKLSRWFAKHNIHLNIANIDQYIGFDNQLLVCESQSNQESQNVEIKDELDVVDPVIEVVSVDHAFDGLEILSEFFETNRIGMEFYYHYSKLKSLVNEYSLK